MFYILQCSRMRWLVQVIKFPLKVRFKWRKSIFYIDVLCVICWHLFYMFYLTIHAMIMKVYLYNIINAWILAIYYLVCYYRYYIHLWIGIGRTLLCTMCGLDVSVNCIKWEALVIHIAWFGYLLRAIRSALHYVRKLYILWWFYKEFSWNYLNRFMYLIW